ncbi:cupin domain-containing protein [Mycobacteroides abscessus]|uniref:cupin domain-containing protein n=1 Tax=Mycobacteroides abscessus TaxID=36809 RepID=UPI0009A765AF|nr:cupin domain-containing protein [Mycobacteroides abscessus]
MASSDAFHPDLSTPPHDNQTLLRNRLHHIRAADLDNATAQTMSVRRLSAISGEQVGSQELWMGETHVAPLTASANHHHGHSETAIYIQSGHPEFVFHDGIEEVRIKTQPGDYIFVPPFVPHREENPDPDAPAVVVIARTTQEAIVVNIPALYHLP